MDIYNPAVLNRVVQDLKSRVRAPFLLGRYFSEISTPTGNVEEIAFDVLEGKPRLAPFCSPLVEGVIVESMGYKTGTFKPAYIKDKRVFEDGKAVRRPAGAPINTVPDGMTNRMIALRQASEDQLGMLRRRLEWMAASALRTGTVTVSGEKYQTTVVNFGRDPSLTVTLSGTARWNDSAPTPVDDLETFAGYVRDASGANATDVVMAQNVWNVFRKNPDVKDLLDRNKNLSPSTDIEVGPAAQKLGFSDKGYVGDYHIFIYSDMYVDENGATQKFLPDGELLMLPADGSLEGVQHFGAIKDETAGFQALDFFSKSWTEPDPAVRYLLLQSAPLVVPYRINASLKAKVL